MAKYDAGVVLILKRYDSPSPQRWNQKILWLNYYGLYLTYTLVTVVHWQGRINH